MDYPVQLLSPWELKRQTQGPNYSSPLSVQPKVPEKYIWPRDCDCDDGCPKPILDAPVVDLHGFFQGDDLATKKAANLIRAACQSHGFFQVINHGVNLELIDSAIEELDRFFKLPFYEKLKVLKKPGSASNFIVHEKNLLRNESLRNLRRQCICNLWGYSSAHAERFSKTLPWKETFSFNYDATNTSAPVVDFFKSGLGLQFEHTGVVYQKYSEAMHELGLALMELLALSLEIQDRFYFKNFYEDENAIMRLNYYPCCEDPSLALGTGPHNDPNSITILAQDQIGGLEVLVSNKWHAIQPHFGALVINIGDTFMAQSNGEYKSCLHRAIVNEHKERKSMTYFMCPGGNKVVKPPDDLIAYKERKYPDFTWSELVQFTQKCYRADASTLENFTIWKKTSNCST